LIIELKISNSGSSHEQDKNSSSATNLVLEKIFSMAPAKTKVVLVNTSSFTKISSVDKVVEVSSLNQNSRFKMLNFLLKGYQHNLGEEQVKDITMRTAGFSIYDLIKLCKTAYFEQYKQNPDSEICLNYTTLKSTILKTKPINLNKLISNIDANAG
jgi:hypothetical protein